MADAQPPATGGEQRGRGDILAPVGDWPALPATVPLDAVWDAEAQTWGEDTQEWAEATAPAAQEAWDDSIGLGPDEAVHEAAASAALAGVPVSEEWKAKVRAALDQDDPDAALDAVVAREIGGQP